MTVIAPSRRTSTIRWSAATSSSRRSATTLLIVIGAGEARARRPTTFAYGASIPYCSVSAILRSTARTGLAYPKSVSRQNRTSVAAKGYSYQGVCRRKCA